MEIDIKGLRGGDERAIAVFLDEHFDDVFRFLRQLTRHVQDAEDLTQSTFLRALQGIGRFDGRSSLRTWLHGIAYREFLNWRRSRRVLRSLDPRRGGVDPRLQTTVEREALLGAIARLSPKTQAAFLLVEVQELGIEEAAIVLDIPAGTVKSRLHEARSSLRRLLGDTFMETSHASTPS